MQDRVTDHLDLPVAAVAGVDLHRAVVRIQRRAAVGVVGQRRAGRAPVGPHVGLQASEQAASDRTGGVQVILKRLHRLCGIAAGAGQHELELARVLAPGGEQRMAWDLRRRVLRAAGHRDGRPQPLGHGGPQPVGGMQQEQVDVTPARERPQDLKVAGREPGQTEQRQPGRKGNQQRVLGQPLSGPPAALRRSRQADPGPQPPPQLGLPDRAGRQLGPERIDIVARRPRLDHRRAVQRVVVKETGEVADDGQPAVGPDQVRWIAVVPEEVRQGGQPRLAQGRADDIEQRPRSPLGQPRVMLGVDPRGRSNDIAEQALGEGEPHTGADPVGAPGAGAELAGQPLGQPPLHPAGGYGDDLVGERIGQGLGEQRAERLGETVGTLGAVEDQH